MRNDNNSTGTTEPTNSILTHNNSPPTAPPPQTLTNNNNETTTSKNKKTRKRDIVFWNPPFNKNLSTNIGKQFLALVNKHFPANSELASSLNRHTIKLSYSTTQNMSQIIAAHNAKVLRAEKPSEPPLPCNCRNECPFPNTTGCRNTCVIYKAEVGGSHYIGQTQTEARRRISRHRTSFKKEYKKCETALSKFIWDKKLNLTEEGEITETEVKWTILKNCRLYKPGNRACDLCLSEKVLIIKYLRGPKCINKKTDLSNKCTHRKDWYYSRLSSEESDDDEADDVT